MPSISRPQHIKYGSVMLAFYITLFLDKNVEQNLSNIFCRGISDNPLWFNDFGLVKCQKNNEKHLKEYDKYNAFAYQAYIMHMTCPNGVVTSIFI